MDEGACFSVRQRFVEFARFKHAADKTFFAQRLFNMLVTRPLVFDQTSMYHSIQYIYLLITDPVANDVAKIQLSPDMQTAGPLFFDFLAHRTIKAAIPRFVGKDRQP